MTYKPGKKGIILVFCGALLVLGIGVALQTVASQDVRRTSAGVDLEALDAREAMAVANDWRWSRSDVKSYVDSREVVFEFADGTVKRIPLPEDEMLVAIAPYVQRTHQ